MLTKQQSADGGMTVETWLAALDDFRNTGSSARPRKAASLGFFSTISPAIIGDDVSWAATCHGGTPSNGRDYFPLRPSARRTGAPSPSRIPGRCRPDARLWHRHQHRDVQHRQRRAVRPLPFDQPGRPVALTERVSGFAENAPFSPPDFIDVQREQQSFDGIAAYARRAAELSGNGAPVRLDVSKVRETCSTCLGSGRCWDVRSRSQRTVRAWMWPYSATTLGETVWSRPIDYRPHDRTRSPAYTVVGVMPPGFSFPLRGPGFNAKPAAAWVPMAFTAQQLKARGNEFIHGVVGRLKTGTSIEEARAELEILAGRVNERYPLALRNRNFSTGFVAMPLREETSGAAPASPAASAWGRRTRASRDVRQRREPRTQQSGCAPSRACPPRSAWLSRARLLQLLLAEGAILSIAGGTIGILLSQALVAAVPAAVASTLPTARDISVDVRVLAFTGAISILTSILFAVIPLLGLDRRGPGSTLQEEASRTTPGVRRHRMQSGLVVSTVTFAFVLLMGAGLFLRSFSALMATDGGFNPDRVLTASVTLPREGYPTASAVRAFHESLFRRASRWRGFVPQHLSPIFRSNDMSGECSQERTALRPQALHQARTCRGSTVPSFRRSGFGSLPAGRSPTWRSRVPGCGYRQPAAGATVLARAGRARQAPEVGRGCAAEPESVAHDRRRGG